MIKATKKPFSEMKLSVLPGHIFFWGTLPHSVYKLRDSKNKTFSIISQCFFRQCSFPPVYFHSCAPASYLKGPHACFVQLFSCWPVCMFRSSVAGRSVFILLGLPGVEHLQTLWSISLYFSVICSHSQKTHIFWLMSWLPMQHIWMA